MDHLDVGSLPSRGTPLDSSTVVEIRSPNFSSGDNISFNREGHC